MYGTNVDYYVSGFDTAGKRVGSLICDFDPNKDKNAEKLVALKEKAKTLFTDAAVVDVISAADYNRYLTGEYVRGADGKPTDAPAIVVTTEQKQASIAVEYESQISELKDALATATLAGDESLIAELKSEYADVKSEYEAALKEVE